MHATVTPMNSLIVSSIFDILMVEKSEEKLIEGASGLKT